MNQLHNAFTLFLSLIVEAMPFLLLGVLLSGLLLLFIDERKLITLMPRNPLLGALVGSCVGVLFPVCECGNVPVARRLLMQGVPAPVAVGFLLAAPTINPIVIWSTWVAFRDQPEIVVLRVVFSLAIATIVGCVFGVQGDLKPLLQPALARCLPQTAPQSALEDGNSTLLQSGTYWLGQSDQAMQLTLGGGLLPQPGSIAAKAIYRASPNEKPLKDRWRLLLDNTVQELRELGGVLVLGSAVAAAIQVLAPRELILSLGSGPITSIAAMMLLAGLVSICSTVDSFFALSFASTFTSGSILAFLVFGPMIDLKGIGLLLSIFKARAVIYLFVLAAQLTFLLTLSYSFLF